MNKKEYEELNLKIVYYDLEDVLGGSGEWVFDVDDEITEESSQDNMN